MNMRQICTRLLLCTLVSTSALAYSHANAQTTQTSSATAFSEAMRYYQLGKWPAAYGRFVALADHDDVDAARIALFMHRFGPRLYGSAWDASTDQIECWLNLVSQQMAGRMGAAND